MNVQVRYFASVREALGSGETLRIDAPATVGDVRDALIGRSPEHARALGRDRLLRSALDQTLCAESVLVTDGAEVGFFPPVTGG
jgi:sulfur-carrier protein